MTSELANFAAGLPERFVPDLMKGDLADAEHLNRYWWAAPIVAGRRVLDAGCGTAYGSAIMASAATEVVGVDIAAAVLESVRLSMPANVRLEKADVASLPFPDASFDAVVSFEAIEHIEDPFAVLDEFKRVVRANGGILIVSSAKGEAYVPVNPQHRHRFEPEDLRAELGKRFDYVQLFRQADWITSAILDDSSFTVDGGGELQGLDMRKVVGASLGSETCTLAVASSEPLTSVRPQAVLTHAAELRRWMALWDEQRHLIQQNVDRAEAAELKLVDRADLRDQLVRAEQGLAAVVGDWLAESEVRMADLEAQLAAVKASRTWRFSAPLRFATGWVRSMRRL